MKQTIFPQEVTTACVVITSGKKMSLAQWDAIRLRLRRVIDKEEIGRGEGLRVDLCTTLTEDINR